MKSQTVSYHWMVGVVCSMLLLTGCRLGRRPTPTPVDFTLPATLAGTQAVAPPTTYMVQAGEVIERETYTGRVVLAHQEESSRCIYLYFRMRKRTHNTAYKAAYGNHFLDIGGKR